MKGWYWMLKRFGLRRTVNWWREGRRRGWMTEPEHQEFLKQYADKHDDGPVAGVPEPDGASVGRRHGRKGRAERSEMVALLRSDLYVRVAELDPDVMTWESPLRWKVRISGDEDVPIVEIIRGDGHVFCKARPMTAAELDTILP